MKWQYVLRENVMLFQLIIQNGLSYVDSTPNMKIFSLFLDI